MTREQNGAASVLNERKAGVGRGSDAGMSVHRGACVVAGRGLVLEAEQLKPHFEEALSGKRSFEGFPGGERGPFLSAASER